uniref:Erythrocyte membrane protein band 4.1 like 3 n=1 Tax=Callorhinchus milii TaxID=7868 RepID=A0A4W3JEI8_CALMI
QQEELGTMELLPAVFSKKEADGASVKVAEEQQEEHLAEDDKLSQKSSSSKLSKSPLKGVKKLKTMLCKVTLLDSSEHTCEVEKRAKGQVLFDKVCGQLNLLEKDYFGLAFRDSENQKVRSGGPWQFSFNVKFYPPDPAQLSEDITRYYLCLQLRDDIVSGRLPCSLVTHALLGSYTVQAELGDYDPDEYSTDYISEFHFAPTDTKELEEKVIELHKNHKGMTPAEAEMHFLENAKKLSMYGVDLHHAKDSEGVDIMLGVCASGLLIYRDRLRINRFAWPKVLKISYKRNNFYIKIRPSEFEQFESTIGFKLPNHRAAKRLWKVCIEHHTFFRLVSPEPPPKKFLTLGSKFRYSGRTQAQTRRASSLIDRPAPYFERSSSKRYTMSRSLDGASVTENHEMFMKDSISASEVTAGHYGAAKTIVSTNLITTVTPEKKAEEEKAEEEERTAKADITPSVTPAKHDTKTDSEQTDTTGPADGETTAEDFDKTQDEVVKHHANITEMKRTFLESTSESGPDEWEKRLSASPVRSFSKTEDLPMIEPLVPEEVIHVGMRGRGLPFFTSQCCKSEMKTEWEESSKEMTQELHEQKTLVQETMVMQETRVVDVHASGDASALCATLAGVERAAIAAIAEESTAPSFDDKGGLSSVMMVETTVDEKEMGSPKVDQLVTESIKGVASAWGQEDQPDTKGQTSEKSDEKPQFEPPVVKTETVSFRSLTQEDGKEISTKEVPVVHTETKTITYESSDPSADSDPGFLMSAQTITSETTSTTTTTHITKTVKGGVSETRIEKRIVITGDADIDHDQALAQAIKEAKEQHPDMSVTKVVVHKETEITPEDGDD